MDATVVDPWVNKEEAAQRCAVKVRDSMPTHRKFDAVVVAVAHTQFTQLSTEEW